MAQGAEPLFGVHFLWGCISPKNRTYRPILRHSASPNQGTCLFIYLEYAKISLYWPHLQRNKPVKIDYGRASQGKFAVALSIAFSVCLRDN